MTHKSTRTITKTKTIVFSLLRTPAIAVVHPAQCALLHHLSVACSDVLQSEFSLEALFQPPASDDVCDRQRRTYVVVLALCGRYFGYTVVSPSFRVTLSTMLESTHSIAPFVRSHVKDRPRSAAVGHHYGMGDYALPDEVLNELAAVGDDVVRVFNYAELVGGGALLLSQSTFYLYVLRL